MPSIFGQWNDSLDHFVHLVVAFLLALPIGWNRSREERGAGLRTFPLVAMAACGFVQTGISVLGAGAEALPAAAEDAFVTRSSPSPEICLIYWEQMQIVFSCSRF